MKRLTIALALFAPFPLAAYACGGNDSAGGGGSDASADGTTGGDGAGGDSAPGDDGGTEAAAACMDRNPLKNPYFGDLHAHTSYSFDAFSFDTRNTPFDAYAFAKGKTLQVAGAQAGGGGPMTTIQHPLDFLAVTDHSEWLALTYGCGDSLDGGPQDPQGSAYYDSNECRLFRSTNPVDQTIVFGTSAGLQSRICDGGTDCATVIRSAWQAEQAAAAAAYEPCKFTSFIAYEWTHASMGATLHKNVIFGTTTVPDQPIDSFNFPQQQGLWNELDQKCIADAGCSVITIPHNSNLSQGGAFDVPAGSESQAVRYQRLVEIFQHKGGSECFFDPNNPTDPACNFEYLGGITEPNLTASYVRTGLKNGLTAYAQTHVNPLQLGIIAATDDHNGTPGNVREDTWPGHAGRLDEGPVKRIGLTADGGANGASHGHNPGGVAVVWAEENTRESIFAALMRRETYATSGPRIVVRFYQTWDVSSDPCADAQFPSQLVSGGAVPMGGTFALPSGDAGGAKPRLVLYAWKDTAEIARLDIVKAWVDGGGQVQEQVITHDVTAGQAACFTWTDPAFSPSPTFYYARVLQTPTPRWSVRDCANAPTANPAGCDPDGGYLNTNIQERAWSSPIWYLP